MGAHQEATVAEHAVELQQFQRGERQALAKGGGGRFDGVAQKGGAAFELAADGAG